jgi:hypothetical protein
VTDTVQTVIALVITGDIAIVVALVAELVAEGRTSDLVDSIGDGLFRLGAALILIALFTLAARTIVLALS